MLSLNPGGNRLRSAQGGEAVWLVNTTYEPTLPAYKRAIQIAALGMPLLSGLFLFFVLSGINGLRGAWL